MKRFPVPTRVAIPSAVLTAVILISLAAQGAAAPGPIIGGAVIVKKEKQHVRKQRLSLRVPKHVDPGVKTFARGVVKPPLRRARVQLEVHEQLGWVRLASSKAGAKKFRIRFAILGQPRVVRVRAVLLSHRHRVAKSKPRRIVVGDGGNTKPRREAGDLGPAPNAYWGAWIGSQLNGYEPPFDMAAVSTFEQMVRKPLSILEFSSPFANCGAGPCTPYKFPTKEMEAIRVHGSIPLLSWASQALGNVNASDFQLSDLIAGTYDPYIREFAENSKAWAHPYFLRFDWEMNGPWFGWGEGANGNMPGEFVLAWQHVHDIFTSVGATNATWVWCPYVHGSGNSGTSTLANFYPGPSYVDWTCLDGYNWGTNPAAPYGWNSFTKIYGAAYKQVTENIAPGKPMLLGELASSEFGGSKARWINEMFDALSTEMRNVRGVVWFEKLGNGEDWPLESSFSSLSAFANAIQESRFLGNVFGGLGTSPIPAP